MAGRFCDGSGGKRDGKERTLNESIRERTRRISSGAGQQYRPGAGQNHYTVESAGAVARAVRKADVLGRRKPCPPFTKCRGAGARSKNERTGTGSVLHPCEGSRSE